jgi:hypothetical protein
MSKSGKFLPNPAVVEKITTVSLISYQPGFLIDGGGCNDHSVNMTYQIIYG